MFLCFLYLKYYSAKALSTTMKTPRLLLVFSSLVSICVGFSSSDVQNRRLNHYELNHLMDRMVIEETDPELLELQRLYYEWSWCTNSFANKSFTEMTDVVPDNTIFLSRADTGFKSDNVTCNDPITRSGTIATGMQRIMMQVDTEVIFDGSDDYLTGWCSNSTEESEASRQRDGVLYSMMLKDPNNTQFNYLKVDNVSVEPFFLYDNRTYYLKGCPDNRTNEEWGMLIGYPGDGACDEEAYQSFTGLDVYPMYGWWGMHNHIWTHNEQHTFEFGVTGEYCLTVKYILTAKDSNLSANNTETNNTDTSAALKGHTGGALLLSFLMAGVAVTQLWL